VLVLAVLPATADIKLHIDEDDAMTMTLRAQLIMPQEASCNSCFEFSDDCGSQPFGMHHVVHPIVELRHLSLHRNPAKLTCA
jgi:hypothetical protein